MRRFDPHLSDDEIAEIALAIAEAAAARAVLNPKKRRLGNAVAPVDIVSIRP
jgi:cytochrome c553